MHHLVVLIGLVVGLAASSRLNAPVLPLIVRTPYLSTWLADARGEPWSTWPIFYDGQSIGLSILAAVPGSANVYPLLGRAQDSLDADEEYNVTHPTYLGAQYDAATTNLSYLLPPSPGQAGSVEVTLSFVTPITPTSTLRQSLPAGYVAVYVKGTVDVNVYIDVNGQWVSGDRGSRIVWDFVRSTSADDQTARPPLKTWTVRRETEQLLTEFGDQAEWGTLHFSGPDDARHQSGTSALVRRNFARTGTLDDQMDASYRTIMDHEPVFAFSRSFHLNASAHRDGPVQDRAVFTIAHVQNPVVQFASARGLTLMRPLWLSWFRTVDDMVEFHHRDFAHATELAANYSSQLALDAVRSGNQDYADILALSARQVLGATVFAGTPEDPILFLKEISSDGNCQTIDVIFPSFPFYLYTNPRWLAYLLEPLFEHTLSGQYPNDYAMHDLGSHFPNVTGHPDGKDEYMPVEECGDIIIMGLALINSLLYRDDRRSGSIWSSQGRAHDDHHQQPQQRHHPLTPRHSSPFPLTALESRDGRSSLDDRWGGPGKGSAQAQRFIARTYLLWKRWTTYLVKYSLLPESQLSTDDFAGWLANQTNLALKGVLGIQAMSRIAELAGHDEDATYYKNVSSVYLQKWEEYGMSRDKTHAKLAYNWYGSWTTLYNLFADSILCFHLTSSHSSHQHPSSSTRDDQIPLKPIDHHHHHDDDEGFVGKHIYKLQSRWYHNVMQRYGLPLDSRHLYTKTDWEFFAAAVAGEKVRNEILTSVARWVNETSTDRPLVDLHDTEGHGGFSGPQFKARPVVGGHFSFVALERACDGKAMEGLRFLEQED